MAAGAGSLDDVSVRTGSNGKPFTLRWMMLHLIEETARHAGHADLLREAIDGVVGEWPRRPASQSGWCRAQQAASVRDKSRTRTAGEGSLPGSRRRLVPTMIIPNEGVVTCSRAR